MKRLCKSTNKPNWQQRFSRSSLRCIYLAVVAVLFCAAGTGEAVTLTSLQGNVFVILPSGKVQEAHYGQKLPDFTEIMTDESSQVAWRDEAGNFFQLATSGHVRFLNKIVELQQGHLWLKTQHPQAMSIQTANAVVNFQKADGIISFDPENSRTQVLATSGQFELGNILVREVTQVIGPGQFSFIDPQYEEGRPRLATSVGKNSYKKMTNLFIGHHEDGLPAPAAPARLPASQVEAPEVAVAATSTPAVAGRPLEPPPTSKTAALPVPQPAAAQGNIKVKTYGNLPPVQKKAVNSAVKDKVQPPKNPQIVQEVVPPPATPAPQVTPGKIVYYLPDYERDHQVQRAKVADFYQRQVAQMVATPVPTPFKPDYTTKSNTTVKVLGSHRLPAATKSPKDVAAKRALASEAVGGQQASSVAPTEKAPAEVASVEKTASESAGSAVAAPADAASTSASASTAEQAQKRDPASVADDNTPLEKITFDQFTKQMRLSNEADKLMKELKSYRIDRQGR